MKHFERKAATKKLKRLLLTSRPINRAKVREKLVKRLRTQEPNFSWCRAVGPSPVAFVTFKTLRAVTEALDSKFGWKITRANKPEDILHEHACEQHVKNYRLALCYLAWVLGLVFCMAPVMLLQNLVNPDTSFLMKWSAEYLKKSQVLQYLVRTYLPNAMMNLWLVMIPCVLRLVTGMLPWLSKGNQIRYISGWTFDTLVAVILVSNCAASTFIKMLDIQTWRDIFEKLNNQSAYFFNYVLYYAGVSSMLELLRYRVWLGKIPCLKCLDPCLEGPEFDYNCYIPWMLMVFTLVVVMAPVAPLILLAGAAHFFISYGVYLWQQLFIYQKSHVTHGVTKNVAQKVYWIQLLLLVVTLLQMTVKKAYLQPFCIVPLFFYVHSAANSLWRAYGDVFKSLPLNVAAEQDRLNQQKTVKALQHPNPYSMMSRMRQWQKEFLADLEKRHTDEDTEAGREVTFDEFDDETLDEEEKLESENAGEATQDLSANKSYY